jgi:hypothetical protein
MTLHKATPGRLCGSSKTPKPATRPSPEGHLASPHKFNSMNNLSVTPSVQKLLGDILYSEIKRRDAPMSARGHLLSAVYAAWVLDGRGLSQFGPEERQLLEDAKEYISDLSQQAAR